MQARVRVSVIMDGHGDDTGTDEIAQTFDSRVRCDVGDKERLDGWAQEDG